PKQPEQRAADYITRRNGAVSSAISLGFAMSTGGAGPHLSTPTAYAERRMRRTHVGKTLLGKLALRIHVAQRFGEGSRLPKDRVELDAQLLIETLERELPLWRRAPIGHHIALVSPGALEDFVQEVMAPTRVGAVHLVVAAQDRARLRALDG